MGPSCQVKISFLDLEDNPVFQAFAADLGEGAADFIGSLWTNHWSIIPPLPGLCQEEACRPFATISIKADMGASGHHRWQSVSAAIAHNTLTGFFLMAANVAITAIPVTVIPKEIMGVSMGIINFGNQMAGFLAPTIIAFLVQFS
jgi:hypothetical protein